MRAFACGFLIVLAAYELAAAIYHGAHERPIHMLDLFVACSASGLAAWLLR